MGLTQCSSSAANSPPDLSYPKAFCILSPPHIHPALTATNHYCAHHAHNSLLLFLDFTRVALHDSQLKIILSNADLWCSPSVGAPKRLKLLVSIHSFLFNQLYLNISDSLFKWTLRLFFSVLYVNISHVLLNVFLACSIHLKTFLFVNSFA